MHPRQPRRLPGQIQSPPDADWQSRQRVLLIDHQRCQLFRRQCRPCCQTALRQSRSAQFPQRMRRTALQVVHPDWPKPAAPHQTKEVSSLLGTRRPRPHYRPCRVRRPRDSFPLNPLPRRTRFVRGSCVRNRESGEKRAERPAIRVCIKQIGGTITRPRERASRRPDEQVVSDRRNRSPELIARSRVRVCKNVDE